jgi:hypothetical protein
MIDWTTVIVTVLGFVTIESVFRIIDRVRYKREDKKLKKNAVEDSDLDNESKRLDNDIKQMDVGSMYLEKVQKLADMMEESATRMVKSSASRDGDWAELKEDMSHVKGGLSKIESDVAQLNGKYELMEEYLNGGFTRFREEQAVKNIKRTKANRYEKKKDTTGKNPRLSPAREEHNADEGCEALQVPSPVGGDL